MRTKKSMTLLFVPVAVVLALGASLFIGLNGKSKGITDADFADVEFQLVDSAAGDLQQEDPKPLLTAGDQLTWNDHRLPYNAQAYLQHQGEVYRIKKGTRLKIGIATEDRSSYEVGFCSDERDPLAAFFRGVAADNEILFTAERDMKGYFYVWNMSASELPIDSFTVAVEQ